VDRLKWNVPVDSPDWDMSEQLIALEARKKAMHPILIISSLVPKKHTKLSGQDREPLLTLLILEMTCSCPKSALGNGGTPAHGLEPTKLSPTSYPGTRRLIWRLCALCAKDLLGPRIQSLSGVARS
jgi:hypothetical protein